VTSTFDDGAPAWTTRGAKVTFRSYSSMLIRGMGKKSKSQTWLGTAGHHRESRQRQRSLIYGASNWSLAGRRRLYIWDSVRGRLACRHPPRASACGQACRLKRLHFMLCVLCHLAHMSESYLHILDRAGL